MSVQEAPVTAYTRKGLEPVNCPACKRLLFKVERSELPMPIPRDAVSHVSWAMVARMTEIQIKCTCSRIIGYSISGETRVVAQ